MTVVESQPTSEELILRRSVTVYVNSFEQLSYLRNTVSWFRRHGFGRVIVLEQGSTYPPLLEYFKSDEFQKSATLHRLPGNVGPRAALDELPYEYKKRTMHVFTDPDLAMPEPPAPDFISRLVSLALSYQAQKVGVALDISEPTSFHTREVQFSVHKPMGTVVDWESQFWENEVEPDVYHAQVDTTFHLFNPQVSSSVSNRYRRFRGIREKFKHLRVAGRGFTARHLPWYRDDEFPAEEKAHFKERTQGWTNWVAS